MKTLYLFLLSLTILSCTLPQKSSEPLKIAFGSCSNQNRAKQMWAEILKEQPEAFIFTGDAIYPKTYDVEGLANAYKNLLKDEDYLLLNKTTQVYGVYDDHDYGLNDGGKYNPIKQEAKDLFLNNIIDSDLTQAQTLKSKDRGLYYAVNYDRYKTKIIILDTRYNRTDLKKSDQPNERYATKEFGTFLGDEQWEFLEEQLKEKEFKNVIVVSSIQVVNDTHHFEKWGNIQSERNRLINLIEQHSNKNIVVLSGDRHIGEVSKLNNVIDVTSSGLTEVYEESTEKNPLRISDLYTEENFGLITIDGSEFVVELIGANGKRLYRLEIK